MYNKRSKSYCQVGGSVGSAGLGEGLGFGGSENISKEKELREGVKGKENGHTFYYYKGKKGRGEGGAVYVTLVTLPTVIFSVDLC